MDSHSFSCLIIDQMHPSILPMLAELGIKVDYKPDIKATEIKAILPEYDGLIVRSKIFISEEIIKEANNLKFIGRAGAGVDNIDQAALDRKGIKLLNAPEGNSDAVGEFTLGLLLALFRNIVKADKEVREEKWQREANRGEDIMGKTIGIIGYGHMGRAFAKRLSGFNCQVLAYDKDDGVKIHQYAQQATLADIFERADVLSFHIPYTPENKHFANENFFQQFQKRIWVLNTARGEIIDQSALVNLLKAGKIKGAALDVLENEKLNTLSAAQKANFEFLTQAHNVILTPHIGGWSHQSYVKINEVLTLKIKAFLENK